MEKMTTTLDGMLNKRVTLEQPIGGYRVAVDTALLAAAVPALTGDNILDMGCGVGGAMLCLACRVEGLKGVGIEIQDDLVNLCHSNIKKNPFAAGLAVVNQDVTLQKPHLQGVFDHVLMNPPYHEDRRHDASRVDIKRIANTEKPGDLALWIGHAASALKPSGTLTLIHRADRREEILSLFQRYFGDVDILSILPKEGAEPKRVIFRGRKNALFAIREYLPLVLHEMEGRYTEAADKILRHAQPLVFQSP